MLCCSAGAMMTDMACKFYLLEPSIMDEIQLIPVGDASWHVSVAEGSGGASVAGGVSCLIQ